MAVIVDVDVEICEGQAPYYKSKRRDAGDVITVNPVVADWMETNGIATKVKKAKPSKATKPFVAPKVWDDNADNDSPDTLD